MGRLPALWRNLVRRRRAERDLDDELRATVDALVAEKTAQGAAADEARRAALVELGGIESVKEQVRDVRAGAIADSVVQDVRYAARLLIRNPLFTLTAALSLAIGIGATTSIFSVGNGLLFRPAAGVADPASLVDIVRRPPNVGPGFVEQMSFPMVLDVRRQATTLEEVYAYQLQLHSVGLRFDRFTTAAFANLVTANYFRALGVRAAVGRVFDAGDGEEAGQAPIAVISHRFWMRQFSGDPRVVGQTVRLNGIPLTVVGVAAEGFNGLSVVAPDLWLPVSIVAAISPEGHGVELTNRSIPWLSMGGRLRRGVSRAQASTQIATIGAAIQQASPDDGFVPPPGTREIDSRSFVWSAEVASPIPYGLRGLAAGFLALLMTLVAIVLVIACANLAGVLLARATSRRREIAVRTAVGAGRRRLMRQLLTEAVLLFGLGGVAGLSLARVLTGLLISLLPQFQFPVTLSAPLDARVVAFALVVSFVAAILSGLAPALHASKSDVVTALKDDSQGPVDRLRLRNAFVVAQVAFSLLLVVTAGLLVRAFDNTLSTARGFDPRGVDVASIDLTSAGYSPTAGRDLFRRVLDEVRAIPGVEHATVADHAPGPGVRSFGVVSVPGATPRNGRAFVADWTLVAPDYFRTIGIPLLFGRDFSDADREGAELVAVVGQSTAERLWPGKHPIGQIMLTQDGMGQASTQGMTLRARGGGQPAAPVPLRVVGVVGDLLLGEANSAIEISLYVPLQQRYLPQGTILVRRDPDGPSLAPAIGAAVTTVAPNVAAYDVDTLEKAGTGPVETQLRIAAAVAGSVGVVGLLLAAIGVYGVTAYAVTQRTREIGIRLSLGAGRREVVTLVLRQGMTLVAVGAAIGLALGLGAGKMLAGRQFGVPQSDPVVLGGAALLFVVVGLVACYVPVRRAARIRAMEALRYE